MFTRCLRADFYKMKRSSVIIAHIIIPIVVSAVFLAYYAISGWNETDKIIAFYETLGSAFPVLIGIFIASTMEQEQNAGAFQNLLTLRSKTAALFSKVVTLLVFGLFALLFTAVIFGFGFNMIHGHSIASMGLFVRAVLVMWLSAIPLYLIFEIFALANKNYSDGKYYKVIPRTDEYVVLQYRLKPQYKSLWMNEHMPNPEILLMLFVLFCCIGIMQIFAKRFGYRIRKKMAPMRGL